MFRELLPNLVAPIVVYSTLVIPQNILLEAALSYLGVGINPPQASWGEMLAEATPIFATAWWFFLFPGARAPAHRARLQPARRRDPRRPRPEGRMTTPDCSKEERCHNSRRARRPPRRSRRSPRRACSRVTVAAVGSRRAATAAQPAGRRDDHRPLRRRRRPHRPRARRTTRSPTRSPTRPSGRYSRTGRTAINAIPDLAVRDADVLERRQDRHRAHPARASASARP